MLQVVLLGLPTIMDNGFDSAGEIPDIIMKLFMFLLSTSMIPRQCIKLASLLITFISYFVDGHIFLLIKFLNID